MTGWQKIVVVAMCFATLVATQIIVKDPDGRVAISSFVSIVAGWMLRSPGDAPRSTLVVPRPAPVPQFDEDEPDTGVETPIAKRVSRVPEETKS